MDQDMTTMVFQAIFFLRYFWIANGRTDGQIDGQMDRRTDIRTETPVCRDATTYPKSPCNIFPKKVLSTFNAPWLPNEWSKKAGSNLVRKSLILRKFPFFNFYFWLRNDRDINVWSWLTPVAKWEKMTKWSCRNNPRSSMARYQLINTQSKSASNCH